MILKNERMKIPPIIAMTADAMSGVEERVAAVGMKGYITKPISIRELFDVLVKWIKPRAHGNHGPGQGEAAEQGSVAETNADGKKADEPVDIPELIGLDLESALERAAGNKKLFLNLLKSFVKSQSNFAGEIRQALDQKDRETAERIAHTLKGISGNIGANEIFEASKKLDLELKKEDCDRALVEEMIIETDRVLQVMVTQINEKLGEKTQTKVLQTEGDPQLRDELLEKLKAALENFDTESAELFTAFEAAARPFYSEVLLDEIREAIEGYGYEAALNGLSELEE